MARTLAALREHTARLCLPRPLPKWPASFRPKSGNHAAIERGPGAATLRGSGARVEALERLLEAAAVFLFTLYGLVPCATLGRSARASGSLEFAKSESGPKLSCEV